ncbi:unnamed protein product, partial [Porites lobata]
ISYKTLRGVFDKAFRSCKRSIIISLEEVQRLVNTLLSVSISKQSRTNWHAIRNQRPSSSYSRSRDSLSVDTETLSNMSPMSTGTENMFQYG